MFSRASDSMPLRFLPTSLLERSIMRKALCKAAGSEQIDLTCICLYIAFVLGTVALVLAWGDRATVWEKTGNVDVTFRILLGVFGALASLLALRGNTYSEDGTGPFYRNITREGRAAITVIATTTSILITGNVLAAQHQEVRATQEKHEASRLVAESYGATVDSITLGLQSAQQALQMFIQTSGKSISEGQVKSLNQIIGQMSNLETAADQSARNIQENVESLAIESNVLIGSAISRLDGLAHPDTGIFANFRLSHVTMDTIRNRLGSYAQSVQAMAGSSDSARIAVADSLGTLASALTRLQSGTLVEVAALRDTVGDLRVLNAELNGRVRALTEAARQREAQGGQVPRDTTTERTANRDGAGAPI